MDIVAGKVHAVVQRVMVIARRKKSMIGKNPFMHRGKKYTVNHRAEKHPQKNPVTRTTKESRRAVTRE